VTYKTILAHCNDSRRVVRLANVAGEIASRFGAHLIGLSVAPPVRLIPAGMPGTPDVIVDDAQLVAYHASNPELKRAFLETARAKGITAEWRERDADSSRVSAIVLACARRADLVLLVQKDPTWPLSSHLDVDDSVILGSGRPVMLVPNDGLASASARRILVAWNGTREASRAVFDAVPLLQQAEAVKIISVSTDEFEPDPEDREYDICSTLVRHNIKCTATEHIASHADVGQSLAQQAVDHRADLIVMGCYGHSRLREFVFGGASRHLLRHMTIPVLMSH
jgi:nucleotide-binding universal stress UspA family protein